MTNNKDIYLQPYLHAIVLFGRGLGVSQRGLHHLLDGMAEGIAQHQLRVALKKFRPRFQFRQELLLQAVAH